MNQQQEGKRTFGIPKAHAALKVINNVVHGGDMICRKWTEYAKKKKKNECGLSKLPPDSVPVSQRE